MTEAHIGLDVGGTAGRWVACAGDGTVLARGRVAGATGHVFNPAERQRLSDCFAQLGAGLDQAGLSARGLVAGITGFGTAAAGDIRALASSALAIAPGAIAVMDDIILAYAAHFRPGEGHLISAGTGSIGIHVTAAGAVIRVGGRGILIDDAGSGSWIALAALDRIYRAIDETGAPTGVEILASEVFALVGGASWHDVRQYVYAGDRGRIGALAVGVGRAAAQGDAVAIAILEQAGRELARLAEALIARGGRHEVALVGGVLTLDDRIVAAVRAALPGVSLSTPVLDVALAAAQLPTRADGGAWRDIVDRQPALG
ncbi:MAG: hypothetical protein KIT02_14740 [Devosia sp.]|uniref:N-acetylglucosamine kinase n=1 Tax=Devosia sp. TaxID=1871048 RepID=UPI0024CB4FF3|nr:BadF/BadG/BcrA/BcrD ATPase family protein [Devosia sp.]UYN99166.1 MAG: hypothetical protein KIT02_14740 [Devosia sp.]